MPRFLDVEVKERVRELYEGTGLTHAKIAARTGVGASTVSVLAEKEGWTRHPEAKKSPGVAAVKRDAVVALVRHGVPKTEIAALAGIHRNTVGRIAAEAGLGAEEAGVGAETGVPPHLADLYAALMKPDLHKDDAAPLLVRAAAVLGAQALVRADGPAAKAAQALGRLAEHVAALPERGAYAGVRDVYEGPQSFDETNELLEEFALRLDAWDAQRRGEAAAAGALDGPEERL
jgi:transposase